MNTELDKTIDTIRRDVWQRVILFAVIFGGLLVSFVVIRDLAAGRYDEVAINLGFYCGLIVILLSPSIPFDYRRWLLISLSLAMAAREYLFNGLDPDSVFFLMTGVALVALTGGTKIGFIFIAGILAFIPTASYLRTSGMLEFLGVQGSGQDELRLLIPYMLETILYCSIINYAIGTLFHRVIAESLERERSLQREKESEEKFLLVERYSMVGVLIVQHNRIIHYNDAALALYEYSREEVDTWDDFTKVAVNRWHPDDREFLQQQIRIKQNPEPEGAVPNHDYRIVMPDGRIKWVNQFSKTITLNDTPAVIVMMMDVTGKKEADAEKRRLEDQINQTRKMEAVGRLAGGVAHDLNNLLTPILGYGDLILNDGKLTNETRSHAEQVVYASNSARELVQQLLTFSRKQGTKMERVDFNALIEGFRNLVQFTLRENVEFDFKPGDELSSIMGDRHKLEQVVMNLIVNGQDAMPDGGTITLSTGALQIDNVNVPVYPKLEPGDYVVVRIQDTGQGIDAAVQSEIFDPFFTTKGVDGTGLGLATVYGIVKQHEGHITVSSNPGKGTAFTIYLPAAAKEEPAPKMEEKPVVEARAETNDNYDGLTVLLAEDNKQVNRLAEIMLTEMGCKVLAASDGLEAIEMSEAYGASIDLLLTDFIMPGMDGKELYETISGRFPGIKVIFMSGFTDDIFDDDDAPPDAAFIQKPFTAKTLGDALRTVFENQVSQK